MRNINCIIIEDDTAIYNAISLNLNTLFKRYDVTLSVVKRFFTIEQCVSFLKKLSDRKTSHSTIDAIFTDLCPFPLNDDNIEYDSTSLSTISETILSRADSLVLLKELFNGKIIVISQYIGKFYRIAESSDIVEVRNIAKVSPGIINFKLIDEIKVDHIIDKLNDINGYSALPSILGVV